MEGFTGRDDMMLLLDSYSPDSQSLVASFRLAGNGCPAAVIEDDGFLPEDVISVYGFFLGDFRKGRETEARPKYFNEIAVPDYWEISGDNGSGKVSDLCRERGRIFYAEPRHKRLVRVVDWYDERHVVRASDHYNRYGAVYARTIFNAKGQKVNKSYFAASGQEVIVENYVTGDIILNDGEEVRSFRTKTEFVLFFLSRAGFRQNRIFFNSLSTPFFVSNQLRAGSGEDILFWQEPVGEAIPGNMQMILNGQAARTRQIVVQKRHSYDRLIELGADRNKLHRLGFVYEFRRENAHRPEALICTNSDRIEQCGQIVEALPQMHFHIAALTEMSSRLMEMGNYENVTLYPGVKRSLLDGLFERCDYYLDINHESEIVSAVRRAFLQNLLILAFRETVHDRDHIAEEHIYPAADADRMTARIREVMDDRNEMERSLARQREAAMAEEAAAYGKL